MPTYKPRNLFARQAMPTSAGIVGSTIAPSTNYGGIAVQVANNAGVARYGLLWAVPSGGSRTTVTQVGPTFTIPSSELPLIIPIQDVLEQHYALHAWTSGADVSIAAAGVQETP